MERADDDSNLRLKLEHAYANLPAQIKNEPRPIAYPIASPAVLMQQIIISLEYKYNLYLLERIPTNSSIPSQRKTLLSIAQNMLHEILAMWSRRDFMVEFQWQFVCVVRLWKRLETQSSIILTFLRTQSDQRIRYIQRRSPLHRTPPTNSTTPAALVSNHPSYQYQSSHLSRPTHPQPLPLRQLPRMDPSRDPQPLQSLRPLQHNYKTHPRSRAIPHYRQQQRVRHHQRLNASSFTALVVGNDRNATRSSPHDAVSRYRGFQSASGDRRPCGSDRFSRFLGLESGALDGGYEGFKDL